MAISATQQGIVQLIVGMFDAAPGKSYLDSFTAAAEAGQTLDQLAEGLALTSAFQGLYPTTQTNSEFATAFIGNLVGSTVTGAPLAWAISWAEGQLNAGSSKADVMQLATQALLDAGSTHADFGVASATLANQIQGAANYSETENSNDIAVLQAAIASITSDPATIPAVIVPPVVGETTLLTTGQDNITGTAGDDTFIGTIFDNQNTAQSGDRIDGGEGTDSLSIDVGNSQSFAVTLDTNSVENFAVRAQATATDSNQNNLDAVQIDAERMVGTNRYESNNSRDDVVIEDVRIEDSQVTGDITVAMVQTDPGNVDFGVYFDQPSLRAAAATTAGAVLNLELMDTRSADAGNDPLLNNPYNGFTFSLDGTEYVVSSDAIDAATTYTDLLTAIQTKLTTIVGLENFSAAITGTFTAIDTDSGNAQTGQTITLTNSGSGVITSGNYTVAGNTVPGSSGLHTEQNTTPPAVSGNLITSQVVLDHVGRGSMGGDLVIGGLSTGNTSDSRGVEQFNIVVERDSELQEINSTNNTLREVFITNGSTNGNLVVAGETNLDGFNTVPGSQGNAGFTDVRIIDASTMVGSVNLNTELTGNVVSKYMNLVDTQGNVAADDAEFIYTLGTNSDTLSLTTSNLNLAAAGNSSREDFSLVLNGGAGNDTITHIIGNGAGNDGTPWYENSKLQADLTINGDAGNDTITTTGAGNFTINAGSGDDTVYTDNSGVKGSWAINATAASLALEAADIAADATFQAALVAEVGTPTVTTAATVALAVGAAKVLTAASGQTATDIAAMDAAIDAAGLAVGATQASVYAALVASVPATVANGGLLVSDSAGALTSANNLLYGSTLVITYAGDAANSVIGGVADQNNVGYESVAVTLNTVDNRGSELTVIQAIKQAINSDAVLSKLLSAKDSTGNVLQIDSLIDGVNAITDLEFTLTATTVANLNSAEVTSLKNSVADSTGNSALITDGALDTLLATSATAALASITPAAGAPTTVGAVNTSSAIAAVLSVGNESTATSDNIINLSTGDDVLVLGTNDALTESNDTIVFTGLIGDNTIVNFIEGGAGAGGDTLDFSSYLDGQTLTGTTTANIANTISTSAVTAADSLTGDEIVIQTGITFSAAQTTAGQSWANMTAADYLAAIVDTGTVAYGDIASTINVAADPAGLIGSTTKNLALVENTGNLGEYKVFELTSSATEFTAATLVGIVDFGDSITAGVTIV